MRLTRWSSRQGDGQLFRSSPPLDPYTTCWDVNDAFRRRWEEDGLLENDWRYLAVARHDGTAIGWVGWRETAPAGHGIWEIGALLAPEHRSRGAGTAGQRLLAEHLFATTTAHSLWAGTEAENLAEQRCLVKIGFRREGVLRGAHFRDGQWRDLLIYGRLREDAVD